VDFPATRNPGTPIIFQGKTSENVPLNITGTGMIIQGFNHSSSTFFRNLKFLIPGNIIAKSGIWPKGGRGTFPKINFLPKVFPALGPISHNMVRFALINITVNVPLAITEIPRSLRDSKDLLNAHYPLM